MKWGKGTLRWERHTEFSTYLWEGPLGRARRQACGRFAVRQRFQPAGNRDFRHPAGDPQLDAAERKADRRLRSGEPVLFAGRERPGRRRHRFPPGRRRADPDPGARPRHVAGPHRRAGAAADRDRDLPHARHARPAAGAVAVGRGCAASRTGWRRSPAEMRVTETARQPGAACRPHRTCRRARGGCGRQPLPLRRQPRL